MYLLQPDQCKAAAEDDDDVASCPPLFECVVDAGVGAAPHLLAAAAAAVAWLPCCGCDADMHMRSKQSVFMVLVQMFSCRFGNQAAGACAQVTAAETA